MKFRTQFTSNKSKGRKFSQVVCENFQPDQGRTMAQIINDFNKGISPDEINLNGIPVAEDALQANRVVGTRALPIDDAFEYTRVEASLPDLETAAGAENTKAVQRELLES